MRIWDKNSPDALLVRNSYKSGGSDKSDMSDGSDTSDPYRVATVSAETAANTMVCRINQASFLLGRQLQNLEQAFLSEGGFTERLYRQRQEARNGLNKGGPGKI